MLFFLMNKKLAMTIFALWPNAAAQPGFSLVAGHATAKLTLLIGTLMMSPLDFAAATQPAPHWVEPTVSDPEHPLMPSGSLVPLGLCDCHFAEDNMVSCPKDGYFVAGFRSAGYPVAHQTEVLPLSPALCCRPCLPENLGTRIDKNDKAVAVITRDCAPAKSNNHEQCTTQDTLVQGFTHAQYVPSASSYFPHGEAQCCGAAVLLESGLISSLVRCNCNKPPLSAEHLTCGATPDPAAAERDGRIIWGFAHQYSVNNQQFVPASPTHCCSFCYDLTAAPQKAEACEPLGFCNGNGRCLPGGRCECNQGWIGADCLESDPHYKTAGLTIWEITLLVLVAVLAGCCAKIVLCSISLRRRRLVYLRAQAQDLEEAMLLDGVHTDSSAEEWSSDDDSPAPQQPAPVADVPPTMLAEQPTTAEENTEEEDAASDMEEGDAPPPPLSEEIWEEDHTAGEELEQGEGNIASSSRPSMAECGIEPMQQDNTNQKGPQMECLVCMSEKISIVCVPCGHAAMCRKCSRRLRFCPLCRSPVTRRQKLFITLD